MSGDYGVMYREGPAFFTRRLHENLVPGPEMLVPEIYDYMLEEIEDDTTIAIVTSDLEMIGIVELESEHTIRWAFEQAETDQLLLAGLQAYLMETFIALGLAEPVPFGSN